MCCTAPTVVSGIRFASDLQIEEWVQERYGFVPHPFWIDHCKELYPRWPIIRQESSPLR